jgi:hypothetical protein
MMAEPRLEDDVALGIYPICDNCDERHGDYEGCGGEDEPDRMWGDYD